MSPIVLVVLEDCNMTKIRFTGNLEHCLSRAGVPTEECKSVGDALFNPWLRRFGILRRNVIRVERGTQGNFIVYSSLGTVRIAADFSKGEKDSPNRLPSEGRNETGHLLPASSTGHGDPRRR